MIHCLPTAAYPVFSLMFGDGFNDFTLFFYLSLVVMRIATTSDLLNSLPLLGAIGK